MKIEKLSGVCNGYYFWNFPGQDWESGYLDSRSFSEEEVKKALIIHSKAILIVYNNEKQERIIEILEKLAKNKFGLVAKKLSHWSHESDLWMIRVVLEGQSWKNS
mgnify:CR=1 FL=1